MKSKKKVIGGAIVFATAISVFLFQNCAGSGQFSAADLADDPNALSSVTGGQLMDNNGPGDDGETYNFAAGDKASCENSIRQRFNRAGTCSIGAGCDGKNPTLFGACILTDKNGVPLPGQAAFSSNPTMPFNPNAPANPVAPANQTYNFGAADKATCENAIRQRLNLVGTCSIGAGCDNANPGLWGACIVIDRNGVPLPGQPALTSPPFVPPTPAAASASQTYNFGAGDKATCENAVRQRLNMNYSCTIGGGCDGSNPTLWGACVVAGGGSSAQVSDFSPPLVGYVIDPRGANAAFYANAAWVAADPRLGNDYCNYKVPGSKIDMSGSTTTTADVYICNINLEGSFRESAGPLCSEGITGSRYNGLLFNKIRCVK